MKRFNNMSVKASWMLVLSVFTALVLGVGALGGYAVNYSQQALGTLNQVNVEQQSTLNRANTQLLELRLTLQNEYSKIMTGAVFGEAEHDELKQRLDGLRATFAGFLEIPVQPQHEALVAEVKADFQQLVDEGLAPQVAGMVEGDLSGFSDRAQRIEELNSAFYTSAVDFFVTAENDGRALYDDFQSMALSLKAAIGAAVVISLAMILFVLWGITVNVLRPLDRIVGHFEKMAEGDLSARIERRGNNEIGKLFAALARMQESLSRTVGKVRDGSQAIHTGSQSIAHGNSDLSSRTEQQAASLEETASSMEQLTSTVSQNADNARQASQLAQSASQTAERGGSVVNQVVDTMREISTRSHKVVDIIDVIDSIAFQTNILALNASVEAARAGEQGRGFAVVASEVRNLASRSADAAKQIRGLIEASVERVDAGSQLVDQAGSTMGDIVSAVQRVNDIMDEIAAASQEQSNGIGQVNLAITEMDQVTQQNARLVQEASSAANALEREASALRESVALFKLAGSVGGSRDAAQPLAIGKPLATQSSRALPAAKTAASQSVEKDESRDLEWETF
ncbi:methyl-accepting chemotaxis sensory transducer with TarH sensor [Modicisalibacter muralis]|uniref:Methyl-accepting chemotaxis sensory transducer with TarH sensor n=1 Tax=Modicisalibacter muralis TaxID=119000 RepID=A0A1G9FZB6_9GAMM|nr:methyl-accepting chemotaxis protein [Halomonas muralis]SDK93699.1 methyl-accepting chemotaxis sensory transducer with TarH sensor [Halomonas muralis]